MELLEKWSDVLDGKTSDGEVVAQPITEKESRKSTALILENQQKWMDENGLNESSTASADIGIFSPILLPTVRRVVPNLLANEIVGVQPMSTPTGLAFAWRSHLSGTDGEPISATMANINNTTNPTVAGYNQSKIVILSGAYTGAIGDSISWSGHNAGLVVKWIDTATTTIIVEIADSADVPTVSETLEFAGTYTTGSGVTVAAIYDNELQYQAIVPDYTGPMTTADGEKLGEADDMPSISTTLEKQAVEAKTRKLKAEYTIEMVQDLRAQHGMNFEEEMAMILQSELQTETDRYLVNHLRAVSTNAGSWTYSSDSDGSWEGEKFRTLFTRILREANAIYSSTRRGVGNFIIVSPNVATALQTLNSFMYAPVKTELGSQGPYVKLGTLDGRLNVYVDNFAMSDSILVGFKGATNTDAGVIYCPYIPAMMTKVTHEKTHQPAMGIMTRSAIANNMFGADTYYRNFSVDFDAGSLS